MLESPPLDGSSHNAPQPQSGAAPLLLNSGNSCSHANDRAVHLLLQNHNNFFFLLKRDDNYLHQFAVDCHCDVELTELQREGNLNALMQRFYAITVANPPPSTETEPVT